MILLNVRIDIIIIFLKKLSNSFKNHEAIYSTTTAYNLHLFRHFHFLSTNKVAKERNTFIRNILLKKKKRKNKRKYQTRVEKTSTRHFPNTEIAVHLFFPITVKPLTFRFGNEWHAKGFRQCTTWNYKFQPSLITTRWFQYSDKKAVLPACNPTNITWHPTKGKETLG